MNNRLYSNSVVLFGILKYRYGYFLKRSGLIKRIDLCANAFDLASIRLKMDSDDLMRCRRYQDVRQYQLLLHKSHRRLGDVGTQCLLTVAEFRLSKRTWAGMWTAYLWPHLNGQQSTGFSSTYKHDASGLWHVVQFGGRAIEQELHPPTHMAWMPTICDASVISKRRCSLALWLIDIFPFIVIYLYNTERLSDLARAFKMGNFTIRGIVQDNCEL